MLRLQTPGIIVALTLLAVCFAAYGIFIPWFGLYGNDWPYLWHYHLFGPTGPAGFAALDRPLSAWVYRLTTFFFGETVWLYHAYLLVLRWLSGVLLWKLLTYIWRQNYRQNLAAALLFVIYPAFHGQPIAVEFLLHFTVLDLALFSLVCMLAVNSFPTRSALRDGMLTGVGMTGAAGIFSLEYFIGLEVLRPIILWMVLSKKEKNTFNLVKRVMAAWLPYLLVVVGFLFWRVFIFKFPTYQPVLLSTLAADPLNAVYGLAMQIAGSLKVVLVDAWTQTLGLPAQNSVLARYLAFFGAAFLVAFAGIQLLKNGSNQNEAGSTKFTWGVSSMMLGSIALLASGWPFWITEIPVRLGFPWDRSALVFLLGGSLLAAGFIDLVIQPRFQPVVLALLVGLSAGQHYINATVYRSEWEKLRSFAWQMTWRIPGLESGTLVLYDNIPLNRYADTDLTGVLNWTYAPESRSRDIPYKFFDLSIRLDTEYIGLPGLQEGLAVEHNHRSLRYQGNTSKMLVLDYRPPGCVHVLMPGDNQFPGLSEKLHRAVPFSKPGLISLSTSRPAVPPAMFNPEPTGSWCYFYQKADLARQNKDWQGVAALGDRVTEKGLKPEQAVEYLPFIEGYARLKNWNKAQQVSSEALKPETRGILCSLWAQLANDATFSLVERDQIMVVEKNISCSPY